MALVTANGFPVLAATLLLPRSGRWTADLVVGTADAADVTGAITIDIDGGALSLVGASEAGRVGVFLDAVRVSVLGGTGGLDTIATPKAYQAAPIRIILSDLLGDAGETLSADADEDVLTTELPDFATTARATGSMIRTLLGNAASGTVWRFLPDGAFWTGAETWPDSGVAAAVLSRAYEEKRMELGLEAPTLLPGTTFEDERISRVEYRIDGSRIRASAWIA